MTEPRHARPEDPSPDQEDPQGQDLPDPSDEDQAVSDDDSPAHFGDADELDEETDEPGDEDIEEDWDEEEYKPSPGEATEMMGDNLEDEERDNG